VTKKDFEFIAKILHNAKPTPADGNWNLKQWTRTVNAFSEALAQENPQFKLGKFERACETGEGIRATIKDVA
jgi:hypothetical protein